MKRLAMFLALALMLSLSSCSKSHINVDHEHVYGVLHEGINPTCTTKGSKSYFYCDECGKYFDENYQPMKYFEIDPLGHHYIEISGISPTCTESGYESYHICDRCGETNFKELPPTGHHYTEKVTNEKTLCEEATCTTPAVYYYSCRCGEIGSQTFESGEPLGHTLVHHEAHLATCLEGGYTAYDECSVCGYTNRIDLEPLGHDIIHHEGKDPTCNDYGYDEYDTCSRCDYNTFEELPPHGHVYENSICKYCGDTIIIMTKTSDQKGYIVRGFSDANVTSVEIPATYEGLPVVAIADNAFDNLTKLKSIRIPSSIKEIGEDAFTNTRLQDVFYGGSADDWSQIDFPTESSSPMAKASNIYFLNGTRYEKIFNVVLTDKISEIKNYAFYNFQQISSITLPKTITKIGNNAFKTCYNLANIYYDGTLSSWCKIDFTTSESNPMKSTARFNLKTSSAYQVITSIEIDSEVTEIKNYAFIGLKQAVEFIIPASVTKIGNYAFAYAKGSLKFEAASLPKLGESWNLSSLPITYNYHK